MIKRKREWGNGRCCYPMRIVWSLGSYVTGDSVCADSVESVVGVFYTHKGAWKVIF